MCGNGSGTLKFLKRLPATEDLSIKIVVASILVKWILEFLGIPRKILINKGVNFHGKFGLP